MPTTSNSGKHFVLVHGLGHGAWCWYKVVSHLRAAGHQATAVDLGGSGVHPSRLEDIASFYEYIQPLVQILESTPVDEERVVLVGHSYGGLPISIAMEKFSHIVSAAVFISAYMPNCTDPPALQMQQYFMNSKPETFMDCRLTLDNGMPKTAELGEGYMSTIMYRNCQPEKWRQWGGGDWKWWPCCSGNRKWCLRLCPFSIDEVVAVDGCGTKVVD